MMKPQKNLVMVVGHKNPEFLMDTAESVKFYNTKKDYEVVFAIDHNRYAADALKMVYGPERVYVSDQQNGWGRGILRTIIHALDYFEPLNFRHVFTMDSDALCVGPFVELMTEKAEETDVFFVGTVWHSPGKDHGYHHTLRNSGFMSNFPYHFNTDMAAGPCMLWSTHCLKFLLSVELRPGYLFDRRYPTIHFAHDQLSTWLKNCGVGRIERVDHIMEIKWREALPTFRSAFWGEIPITHGHTAIIHPTESYRYNEIKVREYFKLKRDKVQLM